MSYHVTGLGSQQKLIFTHPPLIHSLHMKFSLWILLLSLFAVVSAFDLFKRADPTTTESTSVATTTLATTVYVTITTNGALATVKSTWVQTFMTTYTVTTGGVSAGSVGMGTLSGSVGDVRTYSQTTVNAGNKNAYSGVVGGAFLLLGWLL